MEFGAKKKKNPLGSYCFTKGKWARVTYEPFSVTPSNHQPLDIEFCIYNFESPPGWQLP